MIVHRETLTQYTVVVLQSCNCDVLHRRLGADSDKIPEGWTSIYILHLSGLSPLKYELSGAGTEQLDARKHFE